MTPEFLKLLIKKFPNNYELGEIIRRYNFFYKENEVLMNLSDIQDKFIKTYIGNDISFQKV
jgi:hypothetical protein